MLQINTTPEAALRSSVGVMHAHGALHMMALEAFQPGQRVLKLEGIISSEPTRHTIQLSETEHLQSPKTAGLERRIERHPWLFLNHSCRPNTAVRGRELIALRPIAPYEELSFDYETTEWHMAEPFTCRCGNCGGRSVRGFAFLPAEERERRRPYLAPHLLARIGVFETQMIAV